jgi:hypothetical protein
MRRGQRPALDARGGAPEVCTRAVSPYDQPVWLCHRTPLSLLCGAGGPQPQVLLWGYGEQWRAGLDHVVLAEYHCRYEWRTHKVTELRDGVFYHTRFASPPGALIPLTPQESLGLYRPQTRRRHAHQSFSTQQCVLFELVRTG